MACREGEKTAKLPQWAPLAMWRLELQRQSHDPLTRQQQTRITLQDNVAAQTGI